ncbi:hypothetical protein OPQ81_000182 [Rhizoctonia solani]|nr:hypothetical protein OPQ81_000182 [Rhizoctonia solani]
MIATEPSTMGTQIMSIESNQIRVLTFNCWGLEYASTDHPLRIRAIGDEIAASNYNIVGLQELWVQEDYECIKVKVAHKLPYSNYFQSGILGGGLAIFSSFPIQSTTLHPYSLCGSPLDVTQGDWFVGRAVVSVIIDHPLLGEVEIFNTHLYAKGGESPNKRQMAHRLVGAYEFSRCVNISASLGRHVLAVGDFGCISRSAAMQLIYNLTGLGDAWGSTHGSFIFPMADGVHSPHHAVNEHGVTTDSPLNSYSKGKTPDEHARKYLGKRLDYILFRPPKSKHCHYTYGLRCRESSVVFTRHIPGTEISFSDHFGVSATFECIPMRNGHDGRRPIAPPRGTSYSPATRSEVLGNAILTMNAAHDAAQQEVHKKLVSLATLAISLITLIIGSGWVRESYMNPVLVFASAAIVWCGTTLLYSGFLGGGWETRMLIGTIEELGLMLEMEGRKIC